jgi:hypothetical protein
MNRYLIQLDDNEVTVLRAALAAYEGDDDENEIADEIVDRLLELGA